MAASFGMIGLGTMGMNLILNMADKGIAVCGYDRNQQQLDKLMTEGAGKPVQVASTMQELVNSLEKPRRIMMLVPAGKIVDSVIAEAIPLLEAGDILIDGGNSHFTDTEQRIERTKSSGVYFTGMGVSGGEDGARKGPSMMPGGHPEAYEALKNIFEKIAAQTDGGPCVTFVGKGAAGHYTKMVHNGIEYAMMQLISEVYGILKNEANLNNKDLCEIFTEWNKHELKSFLIEITADVLIKKDDESGKFLVDLILDKAKQKGTGMWTSQNAMDLNVPIPTIDIAVSMRYISAMKDERVRMASQYNFEKKLTDLNIERLVDQCRNALHFGFVLSYSQGLHLLSVASSLYKYDINIAEIIRIWKGGCIIRANMLNDLQKAYLEEPTLVNIIQSPLFQPLLQTLRKPVAELVCQSIQSGLPVAGLSSCLQYFDACCTARLPANLIQGQRDYFGAHTYERIDKEGNFHAEWTEKPLVVTSAQKPTKE